MLDYSGLTADVSYASDLVSLLPAAVPLNGLFMGAVAASPDFLVTPIASLKGYYSSQSVYVWGTL
jgi:hypothetical protein